MKRMTKAALAATMLAATAMSAPAFAAETVGGTLVARPETDTASNLTLILNQAFTTAGKLNNYSLFANAAGDITPLLFTRTSNAGGGSDFTLTGIGATQNVTTGINNFAFGTGAGSNRLGADSYFGFRVNGTGVVGFSYDGGTSLGAFAKQQRNGDGVGSVFSFDPADRGDDTGTGLNDRTYSILANASAVPEPAAWALMIGGFGMVGGVMRRRKTSTKVSFA